MSRVTAKLAFIHQRLWQRDGTYRAAVLLGPPPLLGCVLAAALWLGVYGSGEWSAPGKLPPWAHPEAPQTPQSYGPFAETPAAALPSVGTDGRLSGFESGWRGVIQPIEVSPTLVAHILPTPVATFTLNQPDIDLMQIMAVGPPSGLYVGVQMAMFAVRVAGRHALSIRVERSSQQIANCLAGLVFAGHQLVSDLAIDLVGAATRNFDPVEFDLQPGLYQMRVAFTCWREQNVVGPGHVTVLVRHPGERDVQRASADEILRSSAPSH